MLHTDLLISLYHYSKLHNAIHDCSKNVGLYNWSNWIGDLIPYWGRLVRNLCQYADFEFCETKMLRIRERFWQLKLNTAFLYGLNDRVDGAKISNSYVHATNDKSAIPIYNNFNYVKSNRTKRASGINNRTNNNNTNNTNQDNTLAFDPNKFITNIIESTRDNICNKTLKSIMNLKIDNIRQLLIVTAKEIHISEISYPYNEYLLYVVKDMFISIS